jgi:hypothetical protein
MSWDGYLCLGGVEIINSSRTCNLMAAGIKQEGLECRNCCPCPDIDAGLGYAEGYNLTDTPWYAPPKAGQAYGGSDHIDSTNFAGILVTSIVGLEPGAFSRPVTESAGYGAIIGQGRQVAPQITVTGLLIAATCCAGEYGYRWLRSALRGSCRGQSTCAGDDLVFLACQPETPDLDCLDDPQTLANCIASCNGDQACIDQCEINYATPFDFEAWLEPYFRTFKGAALVGDVQRTTIPRGCPDCYDCGIIQVTFTLSASKPCVYHEPQTLIQTPFECTTSDDCVIFDSNPETCDECAAPDACDVDPDCSTTVTPPAVPQITNPCDVDCYPIGEDSVDCRVCVDIPAGTFPLNGEGTLIVTVDNTAGTTPMRAIKLQVWQNPLDLPPDQLGDCTVCSELNISYLAAGSRLVIDGANLTSNIECPGGSTVRANPFISTVGGSPSFSYPAMDGCAGQFTVCVSVPSMVDANAFVTIQTVGREC